MTERVLAAQLMTVRELPAGAFESTSEEAPRLQQRLPKAVRALIDLDPTVLIFADGNPKSGGQRMQMIGDHWRQHVMAPESASSSRCLGGVGVTVVAPTLCTVVIMGLTDPPWLLQASPRSDTVADSIS